MFKTLKTLAFIATSLLAIPALPSTTDLQAFGTPIKLRSDGEWSATFNAFLEQGRTPPEISYLECRVATPGITFVLTSNGDANVLFFDHSPSRGTPTLNPADLQFVEVGGRKLLARNVSIDAVPKRFSNVIYNFAGPVVGWAGDYTLLTRHGLSAPAKSFFAEILAADSIQLTFEAGSGTELITLNPAKAKGLVEWCERSFYEDVKQAAGTDPDRITTSR